MNKPIRLVYVDQDACTSCQLCTEELPDVFAMNEDDLAYVHNPAGGSEEDIQDSIDNCPGECIHWKDED